MNPQDPLAQLHPLREPAMTGWWPPAPGWWLLALLLLIALAALGWWLWQRYRANAYRRQALAQLAQIRSDYAGGSGPEQSLVALNALLKSVALRAYPRREVAALSGRAWLAFLNQQGAGKLQFEEALVVAHYRQDPGEVDLDDLLACSARWIRLHRGAR